MTTHSGSVMFVRLELEALEDLHTGTGAGAGDVDALVTRDRRGFPVIRASHLKGLLREAGEELIALEAPVPVSFDELRKLLGGDGERSALRLTSAYMSGGRAENSTLIWGSSARVEGSRRPLDDTLRYVEFIKAGSRFAATLRLAQPAALPLLQRLLRRIDRIGGDRNRGGGLVTASWAPTVMAQPKAVDPPQGTRLRLVICNLEPTCLAVTGNPGNLIRSQSFVRGQTLRGALLAWAISNGSHSVMERVSVADALPLPDGLEGCDTVLPMPLSVLTEKPEGSDPRRPWWAGGGDAPRTVDSIGSSRQPGEKLKRPGAHEYLCRTEDGQWLRYAPALKVRLRHQTPRKPLDVAELYSLEEIAEDTRFQTDLLFQDESDAADFARAFAPLFAGDWIGLGRGGQPAEVRPVGWVAEPKPHVEGDVWVLTFTSDLIIRGPALGFLDDLDMETLCRMAGLKEGPRDGWKLAERVVETTVVHGFNGASGLHRAPAVALRRGSCWRVTGPGCSALATALAGKRMLGERTLEGFGRFVIGQPIETLQTADRPPSVPSETPEEFMRAKALQLAAQIPKPGPSLSQLQWLRGRALAAAAMDSDAELQAILDEIASAPVRRPQGAAGWKKFPIDPLTEALDGLKSSAQKGLLIANLVEWAVLRADREARR